MQSVHGRTGVTHKPAAGSQSRVAMGWKTCRGFFFGLTAEYVSLRTTREFCGRGVRDPRQRGAGGRFTQNHHTLHFTQSHNSIWKAAYLKLFHPPILQKTRK